MKIRQREAFSEFFCVTQRVTTILQRSLQFSNNCLEKLTTNPDIWQTPEYYFRPLHPQHGDSVLGIVSLTKNRDFPTGLNWHETGATSWCLELRIRKRILHLTIKAYLTQVLTKPNSSLWSG